MDFIIFFILAFVCVVAFTVWYDKIKPLPMISGLIFITLAFFEFLKAPHFELVALGAQSSERWGAPVHNYVWAIVYLTTGICLTIVAIKKN